MVQRRLEIANRIVRQVGVRHHAEVLVDPCATSEQLRTHPGVAQQIVTRRVRGREVGV
jgi:hypothetical protein